MDPSNQEAGREGGRSVPSGALLKKRPQEGGYKKREGDFGRILGEEGKDP